MTAASVVVNTWGCLHAGSQTSWNADAELRPAVYALEQQLSALHCRASLVRKAYCYQNGPPMLFIQLVKKFDTSDAHCCRYVAIGNIGIIAVMLGP